MPEIDADLFQVLTLVLLVISVILLLGCFAALGRIRKIVEEGGFRSEPAPAPTAYQAAAAAPVQTAVPLTQAQPLVARASAAPVQAAAVQQAAVAPTAQPASSEPFERDGRWWFQRGNELLVYDEQSQQWVPAPVPAGAVAPAAGAPAAATGAVPAATQTVAPAGEGGAFWKCPSCGAVNGTTAASCRMCFAARP